MEGDAIAAPLSVWDERAGHPAPWPHPEVIRRNGLYPRWHWDRRVLEGAPQQAGKDEAHPQEDPAAPPNADADEAPLQFPPYLLLLGIVVFLLYLALYIIDAVVLNMTFVPGNDAPWLSLVRVALDKKPTPRDWANLGMAVVDVPWDFLVGTHFRPGPSLRTLDALLMWSFGLDIAALCTATLLVYWMLIHDQPREIVSWFRSLFRSLTRPWNVLVFGGTIFLFTAPPEVISDFTFTSPAALILVIWSLLQRVSGDRKSLVAHVPTCCYWQMALSFYRLRFLDPYEHQVEAWAGVLQLYFVLKMLNLAKRTTAYCHRCIVHYVNYVVEARGRARNGVNPRQ